MDCAEDGAFVITETCWVPHSFADFANEWDQTISRLASYIRYDRIISLTGDFPRPRTKHPLKQRRLEWARGDNTTYPLIGKGRERVGVPG